MRASGSTFQEESIHIVGNCLRERVITLENLEEPANTLIHYRQEVLRGGGEKKQEEQHKKGKMTARERINYLCDPGSFVETDAFVTHDCTDFGMDKKQILGDGVITGWGKVNGSIVYMFAQDFTVFGGSLSAAFAKKICKIMNLALQNGYPLIGLNDSGGARIHEGVSSLGGYADLFYLNVQASGVIPQISLILGPCAGGAVYSPAITDFCFMVDHTSHMFITGPNVIKEVTGESITFDDLGGSETHTQASGVADLRFPHESEILDATKQLLSYIPPNNQTRAPRKEIPELSDDPSIQNYLKDQQLVLKNIIPSSPNQSYDMVKVINAVVDPESFWEIKPEFAPNILIGLSRMAGHTVGIVANNPQDKAGVLDIDASIKAARFIRFCDSFNIPIITFVDVPGFLPGSDQEKMGIIRHGAKLLYAYCEASVPLLTVITRKAYGGAYDVMASKHIGADLNLAWPTAEIAVMGAQGACNIIFNKEIKSSGDPEKTRDELVRAYSKKFNNPYVAAKKGFIDAVIFPQETRKYLIDGLESTFHKKTHRPKKKHGNIPL